MFRKLIDELIDRLSQSKNFPPIDDPSSQSMRDIISLYMRTLGLITDNEGHWGSTYTLDIVNETTGTTHTILVYRR